MKEVKNRAPSAPRGSSRLPSALNRSTRKRKVPELPLAESLMLLLLENAPAAIAMLDNEMRYLVVSKRWMKDFELGGADLLGKSHYEVFPEISEEWKSIHRRCLAGETVAKKEDIFPRADGRTDWLRWEIHPWRKSDQSVGGIIIFSELITWQKHSEQVLRLSEERLGLAQEAVGLGIFDIEFPLDKYTCSPRALELLGLPPESPQPSLAEIIQLVIPEDRPRVEQAGSKISSGRLVSLEFRILRADGEIHWLNVSGKGLQNSSGSLVRFVGICEDITERKTVDEERQNSLNQLRALAGRLESIREEERTRVARQVHDELGQFLTAIKIDLDAISRNLYEDKARKRRVEAAVKGLQRPLQAIRAYSVKLNADFIEMSELIRAVEWATGEFMKRSRNGSRISSPPYPPNLDLEYATALFQILQRRAMSARVSTLNDDESAQVTKRSYEELRDSLAAIKFGLNYFSRPLPTENLNERRIDSALESVVTCIESVRKISTELRPGILDASGIVGAIEWAAREFEVRTNIKCHLRLPENELDLKRDHSTALFRIFQETLTNIARHSNASEVHIVVDRLEDGSSVLKISDNGRGIRDEEINAGSSLGILGMRERALLLGGSLSIHGVPGGGTEIFISLPQPQQQSAGGNH